MMTNSGVMINWNGNSGIPPLDEEVEEVEEEEVGLEEVVKELGDEADVEVGCTTDMV